MNDNSNVGTGETGAQCSNGKDRCTNHEVRIPDPPGGRITRHCEKCGEAVTVEVYEP